MEREFIEYLRRRLPSHPQLLLGVGDDAAVLRLAQRSDCVVTADLLADGTHFNLAGDEVRRIGRKALAVNLSDLAAMAARPLAAVVSLLLPRDGALAIAQELYEGLLPLAERFHVAIAGGDTNCWDGSVVISVTAIGETSARGPLRRDGASAGDIVLVTGALGGSRRGKHFDFVPRVAEALLLHASYDLHAAIDISDGLLLDLSRICAASGCGAELNLAAIPVDPSAAQWAAASDSRQTALEHALSDGEDFELLLAAPADTAAQILRDRPLDISLTQIGRFVDQPGLWSAEAQGARRPLAPQGYEHGVPM